MPDLFWIESPRPGRLAVMAAPEGGRALEEDLLQLRMAEIDTLVSCLEASEAELYGLAKEAELCRRLGLDFLHHPIPDHTAPSGPAAVELVRGLAGRLRSGRRVAVHCLAGIGRSVSIAGAVLRELGFAAPEVFARLARGRGFTVPETPDQVEWIERYGGRA